MNDQQSSERGEGIALTDAETDTTTDTTEASDAAPDPSRRRALGKLAYAAPVIATLATSGRVGAQPLDEPPGPPSSPFGPAGGS